MSAAGSDWTARSTSISTAPTLLSESTATSVMVGSSGNITAVKTPEPPVMVLLTKVNNIYTFLHFELTDRIYVNSERCYCRQNSKKPCQIVIIETKDKTIDLRRFYAAQAAEKGLYTWDLAPFRIPRHPQFKELEIIRKVEYLTLEFESVAAKDEFRQELESLEKVRNLENRISRDIIQASGGSSTATKLARFKSNFRYLSRPPTHLSEALDTRDIYIVQRFLAKNFTSAASSDYEWLHKLDEAGFSKHEIAELLLENINDSPWIYFTPRARYRIPNKLVLQFLMPIYVDRWKSFAALEA
ncbi:MAG: hypothetical protein L6R38_005681 [Xanthoria sp. 2 TBL-2021]|nr:MAG: hypothetical protein L6R38_005681 [Xanthoria sp. 2 TBL-2021]